MYSDNEWWDKSYIEGFKSLRFTGGDASNLATIIFIDTLEDLVEVKEDLRKALIQNTQAISNLNAKDKQPTVQKPPPPS